jgi:hypothetical protein
MGRLKRASVTRLNARTVVPGLNFNVVWLNASKRIRSGRQLQFKGIRVDGHGPVVFGARVHCRWLIPATW